MYIYASIIMIIIKFSFTANRFLFEASWMKQKSKIFNLLCNEFLKMAIEVKSYQILALNFYINIFILTSWAYLKSWKKSFR